MFKYITAAIPMITQMSIVASCQYIAMTQANLGDCKYIGYISLEK